MSLNKVSGLGFHTTAVTFSLDDKTTPRTCSDARRSTVADICAEAAEACSAACSRGR
jgi:hypothetical protein